MKLVIIAIVAIGLSVCQYNNCKWDSLEPTHNMTDEQMMQVCIEEGIPI